MDVLELVKRMARPFRAHERPAFVIVGAQKAGTSALFKILAAHPGVAAPEVKELHFFDDDRAYARGPAWYRGHFPLVPLRGERRMTFEATPDYLYRPAAAERMRKVLPLVKPVVVLRDPVRRAYSAWNMRRHFKDSRKYAHRHDSRSFAEAVAAELREGPASGPLNDYLDRGDYAPQVARFFDLFGRERVLVLNYRDFKHDAVAAANTVCRHVGLPPFDGSEGIFQRRFNARTYEEPMDPAMKERLYAHFAPRLAALDRLLGTPMDLIEDRDLAR